MGRVCALAAGAILPVLLAVLPGSRAAEARALKIGLPESMFSGVPTSVVVPVAKPFQGLFEKQAGYKGEIVVLKDHEEVAERMRGGTLDVAVLHGFEYAWVKQHADLVPLLISVPASKLQACLVVNAASKAKDAGDLKGSCVAVPGTTKAYCRLYLDRLKEKLPRGCCGTAKLDGTSVEEALDAVATGKCESALVEAASLSAYQRNKPGVGSQIKVLSESETFPGGVILHRKDVFDPQAAARVRANLIKGAETPQGQLLTGLWRLKGFAEVTPAYLAEVEAVLKAFPPPKK